MMRKNTQWILSSLCGTLLLLGTLNGYGSIDRKESPHKGPFMTGGVGLSYSLSADGFVRNTAMDPNINDTEIKDVISLRLIDNGVLIHQPVDYTVSVHLVYYTDPFSVGVPQDINLKVTYDPNAGTTYKGLDTYEFNGAYEVDATVTGVTANNNTLVPPDAAVELCTRITVNRHYTNFNTLATMGPVFSPIANKQIAMTWNVVAGAQEYDIEWTSINSGNPGFTVIDQKFNNTYSGYDATVLSTLNQIFRNNSSRVTTAENQYQLSAMYTDPYMLIRIRAVSYLTNGVRFTGNWDYKGSDGSTYNIISLADHWNDPYMNWQYSAAYAEDGKKKEVISYFDGSLRGRQTVTINNSDQVAVAQENIYDEFGRATASILPAPVNDASTPYLRYLSQLNMDQVQNKPYDFSSIFGTIGSYCEPVPNPLLGYTTLTTTKLGAAKYYSNHNDLLYATGSAYKNYNAYIPDAFGLPLSVTQYTPDNTGRIKLQGGVGAAFQPGTGTNGQLSKTTKYYYGKPEQWELDQLFGNDVGYAEHYMKNMVVDPNGQISVSYLNASGKTIATALAGDAPASLQSLESSLVVTVNNSPNNGASTTQQHIHLLKSDQFVYDASALKLSAHTTYLADAIDLNAKLSFDVQKLVACYPSTGTFQSCANCFYKMTVNVRDQCGAPAIATPYVADIQLGSATTPQTINVTIGQPGEYYVDIDLAFAPDVINTNANTFIHDGVAAGYLQSQLIFIKTHYLDALDVSGCYADCHTCKTLLGGKVDFEQMIRDKCIAMKLDPTEVNGAAMTTMIDLKYDALSLQCQQMQANCLSSPCDDKEHMMEIDVSPGGQYAAVDDNNHLLELDVNVLYIYFNQIFGTSATSKTLTDVVTRDDGSKVSVYDASFSLQDMVKYWRPSWAVLFLPYHPEYCKLQTCYKLSNYKSTDELWQDAATTTQLAQTTGITTTWSSSNAEDWLLNQDPFFDTASTTSLPTGSGYKSLMLADLQNYSKNVLLIPVDGDHPNYKSLIAYTDYVLYCSDKTGATNINPNKTPDDSWNYCTPNPDCRVPDREWVTYREFYLSLKAKYYKLIEDSQCGGLCPIGQPLTVSTDPNKQVLDNFVVSSGKTVCDSGMHSVQISYNGVAPIADTFSVGYFYTNSDNVYATGVVSLSPSAPSAEFCIPAAVPISSVHISNASAPGVNPMTGGNIAQVVIYDQTTNIWGAECGIDADATTTVSVPNGVAPNDITVNINYVTTTNYASYSSYSSQSVQFFIPKGSSSASYDYAAEQDDRVDQSSGYCIQVTTSMDACSTSVLGAVLVFVPGSQGGCTTGGPQCSPLYAYKQSRFPDLTNVAGYPSGPLSDQQGQDLKNGAINDIKAQAKDLCTGNAEMWINVLKPGLAGYTQSQIDNLTNKLIELCAAGGDSDHPMGSSTLATPDASGYKNFGEVIKGELSLTNFTMALNPWLITSPEPQETKLQAVQQTISSTNTSICDILATLQDQAGTTPLLTYLNTTFGAANTLTQNDLNALQQSCTNCKFILSRDITLPIFLNNTGTMVVDGVGLPAPGTINKSIYTAAKNALITQFGTNLDPNDSNYPAVLSNFMNQKFGFALTYDIYHDYEAAIATNNNALLVNQTPYQAITIDPNACVKSAFETAISGGMNAYDLYLAEQRRLFRANYIATCSAAKAYADLDAAQKTYHYTLYYYDQADNLVRTVPPEGVHLLTGSALDEITAIRDYASTGSACTYDGGRVKNNDKTGALTQLGNALSSTGPAAIEMWLYNNTSGISQLTEVTTDQHWLFSAAISGNTVGLDIYPMSQTSSPASATFNPNSMHYRATIPASLMPLTPWTYLLIQGANGIAQGTLPQIWVNGVQLTVVPGNSPLAAWAVTATTGGIQVPDIMPTLKHIRFYHRLLDASPAGEIVANAANNCMMPVSNTDADNLWYRFNIPAAGDPTTVAATSTDETRAQDLYPDHTLKTSYAYNSTNQVNLQQSPDGGMNRFWYDLTSRLVFSQNDKQLTEPALIEPNTKAYSYTQYDVLGRIAEVGQRNTASNRLTTPDYLDQTTIDGVFSDQGTNAQITHTWYDDIPQSVSGLYTGLNQNNLRKRVAVSGYIATQGDPVTEATYYNYDIDGNVSTLWQEIAGLGRKQIDYEFDLVSGKVNFVKYQDGQPDHFYYKYDYDAENRLTHAWSGTQVMYDSYSNTSHLLRDNQKLDAHYEYYLHGPLARLELGDAHGKVQGVDYAYTLQGWLKGVNGISLNGDVGADGPAATNMAKDAFAYTLGYYNGDYSPIAASLGTATAFGIGYGQQSSDVAGQSLYNGNISNSTMAISSISTGTPVGYTYHYDQLNRIKNMWQHATVTQGSAWNSPIANFAESFVYDANGNIKTATRNDASHQMDNLAYTYNRDPAGNLTDNKLMQLTDAVPGTANTGELTGVHNYTYDAIGNLISDKAPAADPGDINEVKWTVYGKIDKITKGNGTTLNYSYNPAGQRVIKVLNNSATTWYVRDAQGNTMGVYDNANGTVNWREQNLYGSTRLGTWEPNLNVGTGASLNDADTQWQIWGLKQYELSNHLGNVMATISDRRLQVLDNTGYHYEADVINAQDYYAFGSLMPGRQFAATSATYRYGFNGKENDNEVKGTGNQQDYGMRIYDPRLGKFLSVDPLYHSYPELSTYQFASNSPISGIDRDGGEYLNANEARIHLNGTTISLSLQNMHQVTQNIWKNRDEAGHWPAGNVGFPQTVGEAIFVVAPSAPGFQDGGGQFPSLNLDNTYGANVPSYNASNIKVVNPLNSYGVPNQSYKERTIYAGGSSSSTMATATLVLNAVNWGLEQFINYQTTDDRDKISEQMSLLRTKVMSDLTTAVAAGYVPQNYLNPQSLGNIANVILTGVNLTKDKNILKIGIRIVKEISNNYRSRGTSYTPPVPKDADHTAVNRTYSGGPEKKNSDQEQ